jgi:hypothetical protein
MLLRCGGNLLDHYRHFVDRVPRLHRRIDLNVFDHPDPSQQQEKSGGHLHWSYLDVISHTDRDKRRWQCCEADNVR